MIDNGGCFMKDLFYFLTLLSSGFICFIGLGLMEGTTTNWWQAVLVTFVSMVVLFFSMLQLGMLNFYQPPVYRRRIHR